MFDSVAPSSMIAETPPQRDHLGVTFVPTTHHDTYPAIDPRNADLSGKVVLITGASKGIGKALAVAFAKAGVSGLVLIARSNMTVIEEACLDAQRPGQPLRVLTLSGVDTTEPTQVADAAVKVRETFGHLDVIINNAGFMTPLSLIADYDPLEWWKVCEVNIRGTFNVAHAFLPLLMECGGDKTIINMTSIAAHIVAPMNSPYMIAKLAILRFSELLVAEYGAQGLISYAVHPGAVATDMTAVLGAELDYTLVDTAELAADTLVWLVGERRDWLSGRYISCLWDVEELLKQKEEIVAGDKLKVRMAV